MDESSGAPDRTLKAERSNVSDYSLESTPTVVASPTSPAYHRPGYTRISSLAEEETAYRGAAADTSSNSQGKDSREDTYEHGLAIENLSTQRRTSLQQSGVKSKAGSVSPAFVDPLLSPSSSRAGKKYRILESHLEDDEEDQGDLGHGRSRASLFEPFTAESEQETLHRKTPSGSYEPPGR